MKIVREKTKYLIAMLFFLFLGLRPDTQYHSPYGILLGQLGIGFAIGWLFHKFLQIK